MVVSHHVRELVFVDDLDVIELDVEILIDGVHGPSDCQIVLQLDCHLHSAPC
jgi:hypothetical protein